MSNETFLQAKIEEIDSYKLEEKKYDSPEFLAWKTSTLRILDNIFGTNSRQYKDFESIKFDNPDSFYEYIRLRIYKAGINEAKITLQNFIQELLIPRIGRPVQPSKAPSAFVKKSNDIFIVHGHDEASKYELARILQENFDVNPIILHEKPDMGRTLIEKFEDHSDVGYAFVLLTSDDVGMDKKLYDEIKNGKKTSEGLNLRARQNVILELGYFIGKLGRNRVCCIYKGELEIPSDVFGILYKNYEKDIKEIYKDIQDELLAAGYRPKLN